LFSDDDLLPLSGLQHILFCERQCALIHVEQSWTENFFTQEGRIMHERVHEGKNESRSAKRSEFGIDIHSLRLGLVGKTDAVEFLADGTIRVVEYKRGQQKENKSDEVQLCAQAICIEEMMETRLSAAYLFYGKTKHRLCVPLNQEIRTLTEETAHRFHELVDRGITPTADRSKKCASCSLVEVCLPEKKNRLRSIASYIRRCKEEHE
jgi:CRISPR-associated exonuclease Cas4